MRKNIRLQDMFSGEYLKGLHRKYIIRKKRAEARRFYQWKLDAELKRVRLYFALSYKLPLSSDKDRVPLLVPKVLSLKTNFDETIALINDIRKIVFDLRHKVFLHFNELDEIEPAAALLLVAEIFRCNNLRPARNGSRVFGNYPKHEKALIALREMGFYRLLRVSDMPSLANNEEERAGPLFMQFRSMTKVNAQFAAAFCAIVSRGVFDLGSENRRRMVAALKEAMGNAHEHAYVRAAEYPSMRHRWYVSAYLDPARCEMLVVILDQGIGIPNRLDANTYDTINAALKFRLVPSLNGIVPSDGHMIAAATELHRTSTGRRGRGKGFRDMKRLVGACDDGELRVRSNRGSYVFTKSLETIEDHRVSISGTLIEWRIRHGFGENAESR